MQKIIVNTYLLQKTEMCLSAIVYRIPLYVCISLLNSAKKKTHSKCNFFLSVAWYDQDLAQYQKERQETELEKVFDERNTTLRESGLNVSGVHIQQKEFTEPETEWQRSVKMKKGEDYYSKIQQLENEQVSKEIRLRESSHQMAIPGEKIASSTLTRGLAQQYQENL